MAASILRSEFHRFIYFAGFYHI